jgi:hypothetical protein
MDLIRILRSAEDFIYEVALWVILVPITFAKVVSRPWWVQSYVASQFEKPSEERFNDYLSPIIFWSIMSVLPYIYAINALSDWTQGQPANVIGTDAFFIFKFINQSFEVKFIIISLLLIGGPLGMSIAIVAAKKIKLSKSTLKRYFYTQCYYFTPLFFSLLIFLILSIKYSSVIHPVVKLIYIILISLWLLVAEFSVVYNELSWGWIKSSLLVIGSLYLTLCIISMYYLLLFFVLGFLV